MSVRDSRQPLVTAADLQKPRYRRPVLTFLIAVTALGLSGFVALKTIGDQATQLRTQGKRLDALESRLLTLADDQAALQNDAATRTRMLSTLQDRVDAMGSSLSADQRRQWQLAEVDYYVRLAEQHLILTRDVQGSKALLDVADRILADTNDNALLKLRQSIAQDRLALEAAARVDVAGVYLRLGALEDRIDQLVLPMESAGRQKQGVVEQPLAVPAPVSPSQRLDTLLAQGWQKFRGLITVRHYEEPIKPLLTDDQRQLIKENLRLRLGQAQLALLRGEAPVYAASLKAAQQDFARYFQLLPANEYNALSQELAELAAVQISPAVPDLKASVGALDALTGRLPLGRNPAPAPAPAASGRSAP